MSDSSVNELNKASGNISDIRSVPLKISKSIKISKINKLLGCFVLLMGALYFFIYSETTFQRPGYASQLFSFPDTEVKYLIYTPGCQIVEQNPYSEEISDLIWHEDYVNCSKFGLLSYIEKTNESVVLHINENVRSSYSATPVSCCYSGIYREVDSASADSSLGFSECRPFENSAKISETLIKVICRNYYDIVYVNVHAIINSNKTIGKKITHNENTFSVLFVGIDSLSQNNFIRTMPKTRKFLEDNGYVNLRGYIKVGDNTFPNIVAIMIGKNWTQVYDYCNPKENYFDECGLIWNKFKNSGYITAYAEDESDVNTFNYGRRGFKEAPADYYFRPYILAAEELPKKTRFGSTICTGPENNGERILNVAQDFLLSFKRHAKFGLFWMVNFSHNDVNLPSSMDEKMEQFFKNIQSNLENTILFFLSDHGIRFGPIRKTYTGYVEERLPLVYIHIPEIFKKKYNKEYQHLLTNAQRLTSPFDIFMTLQDILAMVNVNYTIENSVGCPTCVSLFKEIPETRTCEQSGIPQHWCLCDAQIGLDIHSSIVQEATKFLIEKLNNLIKSFKEGQNCASYLLKEIKSARAFNLSDSVSKNPRQILISIETRPMALFEATFKISNDTQDRFEISGDVSRLTKYAETSKCVNDIYLKKYCYCNIFYNSVHSIIKDFLTWN